MAHCWHLIPAQNFLYIVIVGIVTASKPHSEMAPKSPMAGGSVKSRKPQSVCRVRHHNIVSALKRLISKVQLHIPQNSRTLSPRQPRRAPPCRVAQSQSHFRPAPSASGQRACACASSVFCLTIEASRQRPTSGAG